MQVISYSTLVINNTPTNAGDPGSIPGVGRSPGEENGNPFQYSCLRNPMDRGAWWYSPGDRPEADTTERLNNNNFSDHRTSLPGGRSGLFPLFWSHGSQRASVPWDLVTRHPWVYRVCCGAETRLFQEVPGALQLQETLGGARLQTRVYLWVGLPGPPAVSAVLGPQSLCLRLERPWDPATHPRPQGLQTKTSQGHSFLLVFVLFFPFGLNARFAGS